MIMCFFLFIFLYYRFSCFLLSFFFFFNDTATTEIYTLSLHDALPILTRPGALRALPQHCKLCGHEQDAAPEAICEDRKSTRLNSSHGYISYAVFCLKKKKKKTHNKATNSQHNNNNNQH